MCIAELDVKRDAAVVGHIQHSIRRHTANACVAALQVHLHVALVGGVVYALGTVDPALLRQADVAPHPRVVSEHC